MKIKPTKLPEVLIIEPEVFGDKRGFFMETWNRRSFSENGLDLCFVQDNYSRSSLGVLRGLHYQLNHPQGKLIWVLSGKVFDVAVDIRKGSPTFGQWVSFELSEKKPQQVYIPPGFAHGFCVLSKSADFMYKCTDFYNPCDEHGILWNDPEINIDWPGKDFLISEKDAKNKMLRELSETLPEHNEPNG